MNAVPQGDGGKSPEIAVVATTCEEHTTPRIAVRQRPVDRQVDQNFDPPRDVVEAALADALSRASATGEWAIVAQLARELEARRTAREASNVVSFAERRTKR